MAKDEREEEREFLEGLKARTGRELGEWMGAITAQGFKDKNETIDWLREQGLPFARASWLERIHRNGGKPIYADNAPRDSEARRPVDDAPRVQSKPTRPRPPASEGEEASLEKLLAAGKGYRPLYHLLEAEVRKVVPDLLVTAKSGYVSFGAPAEFAAVTLHATEVRLGLGLGDRPFDGLYQKAKLKGSGANITHMVVLTDARQVNAELLSAVQIANGRVNCQA
jgi:Domain of unknown function (DUF5655)